jgi:hypothetical protein
MHNSQHSTNHGDELCRYSAEGRSALKQQDKNQLSLEQIAAWLDTHPLSPTQIDCTVTVMLKILDGKCKMRPAEKVVMTLLYDQIKTKPGQLLTDELHSLIATALDRSEDDALKMLLYEKRLLAETAISRPVMKQFKAFIRETGLLEDTKADDENN